MHIKHDIIFFFLIFMRVAGFFMISPVLSSRGFPAKIKVLLSIFVALVILVIGFYLARFVSGLVQVFAGNIGVEKPDVIGKFAYAGVIIFIIPVALNQLNIASDLITSTFLLLFGALCLALAIAFGLGSKDLVSDIWEKSKFAEKIKPKKE